MPAEARPLSFNKVTTRIAQGGVLLAAASGLDYLLGSIFDIDLIPGEPIFESRATSLPPLPDSVEEYFNGTYWREDVRPWYANWHNWDLKTWTVATTMTSGQILMGNALLRFLRLPSLPDRGKALLALMTAGCGAAFTWTELYSILDQLTASNTLQWGGASISATAVTARTVRAVAKK